MPDNRQRRLVQILGERGFCTPDELAQDVDVSSVTIRRDLAVLEEQGLVKRVHGGATLPDTSPLAKPLWWRIGERQEQKERIGQAVVSMLSAGQTVMLDAGSTCAAVARALPRALTLRVITHSLVNIDILTEKNAVELIAAGGTYSRELGAFVGPAAETQLAQYHADVSVLAAAHLNVDQGLVNNHTAEWTIKRTIHSHAARCILAVDSSKFGVRGLQSTVPIDELRCEIVTDSALDPAQRELFKQRGLKVIVV
jgi:DeoR family transcriptional regulator of aga operon